MSLPRTTPLASGDRDQILRIEQCPQVQTPTATGYPMETWTTLVDQMPATKLDVGGRERMIFANSQIAAAFDARWQINYRLDMDPDLVDVAKLRRIVHRGRVHDIVSAAQIGRREGIEILTVASTKGAS